jgi:hypothetical protein
VGGGEENTTHEGWRSVSLSSCRQTHVVEQPYADRSTAEKMHLYVTCRGQQYFVGIAKDVGEVTER